MDKHWDVIVVGGGAAGLSAALMLGRARRDVLVIDAEEPRNRFAAHMHGVLGLEGLDPAELLRRGREEVGRYGVEILRGSVERVDELPDGATVRLAAGEVLAGRIIIVATGITDDLADIPGLVDHWGTAVLHCPYCHGWEVRDRKLGVLATMPMGLHQAQLIRQWSDDLTVFTAGLNSLDPADESRLLARGIRLVDQPVVEVLGDGDKLSGVRTADGQVIELDAIFTAGTAVPRDAFLAHLGLDRSDSPLGSFLTVDQTGKTSSDRIWAVGNVVNPAGNVPMSIAAGATAGGFINMVLVTEDFDAAAAASPAEYWENRYAESERIWSGRVNQTMADVVRDLPVGEALELGCGEGGDAVWLAEQGWRVTAIDISATAVDRGIEGAVNRGVADRISWVVHDLSDWQTDQSFDLVTASFLHSTVELPRTEILRRAAQQIRSGGHLLVVSHVFESEEDIPPWANWNKSGAERADGHGHAHDLPTPAQEVAELAPDPDKWHVELQEIRQRKATSPDGSQTALLKDGVILLRRR